MSYEDEFLDRFHCLLGWQQSDVVKACARLIHSYHERESWVEGTQKWIDSNHKFTESLSILDSLVSSPAAGEG